MRIEPDYPVSMTGVHGAGKKTLRDGLCETYAAYAPVDYKLLKLGRMVDEEGLATFRQRILEQDRLVGDLLKSGRCPVTSRLGILDVSIIAAVMARFGRIEASVTNAYLDRLEQDLDTLHMPQALIAVWAPAEAFLERLKERDASKGVKPPRSEGKLARLIQFMEEIFVEECFPHPLIARIVEHYRSEDALLLLDTGELDVAAARARAAAFLEARGLALQPAAQAGR